MRRASERRLPVRLCVVVAGFGVVPGTANAHEYAQSIDPTGAGPSFATVLAVPILVGLACGLVTIRYRRLRTSETAGRRSNIAVGLLLTGLGVATLVPAVTTGLWLSVAGALVGAVTALTFAERGASRGAGHGDHARLTFGAIATHRLFEGVVVGTLYSTGAAIGLAGAVVLAVHTAVETAAVGGMYALDTRRLRPIGAVVLVQTIFVAGATIGVGISSAVPVSIRALGLGAVGGVLTIVGGGETKRSLGPWKPEPIGRDGSTMRNSGR